MRQVFMDVKTGKPLILEVPAPACKKDGILVEVIYSLVSAGTERSLFEFGKKGLISKAKERPDQFKKVIDKIKIDGLLTGITENKSGITYLQRRKWDTKPRLLASTEKAKRVIGYESKMDFKQGLLNTIEWFKENWDNVEKVAKFPPGISSALKGQTLS